MDEKTLSIYDSRAREFAERYENCSGGISEWFDVTFPKRCRVLDVGSGSGRDLALLLKGEEEVLWIVTPTTLLEEALTAKPELKGQLHQESHQSHSANCDPSFDGILCCNALIHIKEKELFDSISSLLPRPETLEDLRFPFLSKPTTLRRQNIPQC